jgi:hypothetical protein
VTGVPTLVAVVGNLRAGGAGASAATDFTGGALASLVYNPYNPYDTPYPVRDVNGAVVTLFNPWPAANLNQEPVATA